jgi:hypothetical protein
MPDLRAAWTRAQQAPDPVDLLFLRRKNGKPYRANFAKHLRAVAKLCVVLAEDSGGVFHLGSVQLGAVMGVSHMTAFRALEALIEAGVIVRVWAGGLCVRDRDGEQYADGALVKRASEYRLTVTRP